MEYIGFFISLLAVIYLYFKQKSFTHHQRESASHKMEPEDGQEDPLAEFIHTMKLEAKKKQAAHPAPPPAPKQAKPVRRGAASPLEQYRLESAVEKRQLKSALENRQLKPSVREHIEEAHQRRSPPLYPSDSIEMKPSRAEVALKRLAHPRDLIIYQEIIGQPKSMRPD